MSRRPPLFDDAVAELRADAVLRALAQSDSLEPPCALDRAVLASAHTTTQDARALGTQRRSLIGSALRWGISAALAAAFVCAFAVHRTAPRAAAAREADRQGVEAMQVAPIGARGSDASRRGRTPAFIEASVSAHEPAHSPARAFPPEREWSAPRAILIDSIDSVSPMRLTLQPASAQPASAQPASAHESTPGSSSLSTRASGSASRRGAPARPRVNPASR